MVLISLQPFILRKVVLVIAALLCFSAFCFADPVFMARQYSRVAVTAVTLPGNPSSAVPRVEQHASPAQVARAIAEVAPSEISLQEPFYSSTPLLSLQLDNLTFSDLNPDTGSNLTRFQ